MLHHPAGTHVSSTAAGRSVGVAKDAAVLGVRVLDCDGAGSVSNVVAGEHLIAMLAQSNVACLPCLRVQCHRY